MIAYYLVRNTGKLDYFVESVLTNNTYVKKIREVRGDMDLSGCRVRVVTEAAGNVFKVAAVVTCGDGSRFTHEIIEVSRPVCAGVPVNSYKLVGKNWTDWAPQEDSRKKAIQLALDKAKEQEALWQERIDAHKSDTSFFSIVADVWSILQETESAR